MGQDSKESVEEGKGNMKIGFIGLGIMGAPMCANIIKKHTDTVFVYNRTAEKTQPLEKLGAVVCGTMEELAQKSDRIITMVTRSEDSREVYDAILHTLNASKICIDMSTIDPSVSVEIAEKVRKTGAEFADAPVVKSRPAAIAGKLGIYVGAREEVFREIRQILLYMGENVIRMGDNGKGLVMKICHNALVSQIQNGVNEMVILAEKNGITVQDFAEAISCGGGQNAYLDTKKDFLDREDYTTAFSVENMAKDVNICLNLAKESKLWLPGEENIGHVYERALDAGYGKEDFCATVKVVRHFSEHV